MTKRLNLSYWQQRSISYQKTESLTQTCEQMEIQNTAVDNSTQQLEKKAKSLYSSVPIKQKNINTLQVFTELIQKILLKNNKSADFQIKNAQKSLVKIEKIMRKIYKLSQNYDSYLIAAIILLDRVHSMQPDLILNQVNIYHYVSMALITAFKYCDDDIYDNSFFAKITEIDVKIINRLEIEFLMMISFQVYISFQMYQTYHSKIASYSRRRKNIKSKSY